MTYTDDGDDGWGPEPAGQNAAWRFVQAVAAVTLGAVLVGLGVAAFIINVVGIGK